MCRTDIFFDFSYRDLQNSLQKHMLEITFFLESTQYLKSLFEHRCPSLPKVFKADSERA